MFSRIGRLRVHCLRYSLVRTDAAQRRDGGPAALLLAALVAALHVGVICTRAEAAAPTIAEIRVEGNQRVETDAIRIHISSRTGQPLDPETVDRDIKQIYQMGFFDSVEASLLSSAGRTILVYKVRERPQITDVRLVGMKAIRKSDDKVIAAVRIHPGSILDPLEVKRTIDSLTDLYRSKGYLDAKVTFKPVPGPEHTAAAVFTIDEGKRVRITEIEFRGNKAFSDRRLRTGIATKTYSFLLSWLTGAGTLDRAKLNDDVDRITALYFDSGYLNAHVSRPVIIRKGDSIKVVIEIDEGHPYKVGSVALAGRLKFPRSELRKLLSIKTGDLFRGSELQHNVLTLSDFYSNRGFAFVNVDPRTRVVPGQRRVNVRFVIDPGREVLVDRIRIRGNTKTSDKVIRRELRVQEQEPYSAEKIRASKQRLQRLGFFTNTRITTSPSRLPDKIDLNVNVVEGNTASIRAAGGFDSFQSIFGSFSIGNSNLFGGGQSILLSAQVGFIFKSYVLSYTEPWFLDIPLSVGVRLFSTTSDLTSFSQSATGFSVQTFYPLTELGLKKLGPFSLENVTAGLGYRFQTISISGFSPFTIREIREFGGQTKTSQFLPSIRRFTVDNPADPRTGSVESLSLQIGGIGGGDAFLKAILHLRYFYPFYKSPIFGTFVVSQGVTFGIGTNLSPGTAGEVPLYERFFPGGVGSGSQGSLRGFEIFSLGPQVTLFDQVGRPLTVENVGGSKELLFSNEITFPILSGLGIRGVVFLDAGQAFRLRESLDLTSLLASWGFGIRWRSPFGPLAIDIAFPLNPRPRDQSAVFEIGAGAPL